VLRIAARAAAPAAALIAMLAVPAPGAVAAAPGNPICARIGQGLMASAGARMFCFGAQRSGVAPNVTGAPPPAAFGTNVNAADPREDVTPSGVRAFGQSETSIAASGQYVVEAWNDATGLFAPCPSPLHKEERTGFAVSGDAGASFVDLGGVPNDCRTGLRLLGDPGVEAWHTPGAGDVFYITSLYNQNDGTGRSFLALNACQAGGGAAAPRLACSQPIKIAQSTQCDESEFFCSFLDKPFLAIDRARGRLYVSYTEFGLTTATASGEIELAACDIGTAAGATGPAGGTPRRPVCRPGAVPRPYATIARGAACQQTGAYPAVDPGTGDVYVAWEFNVGSNFVGPDVCLSQPTRNVVAHVAHRCLVLAAASPCRSFARARVGIVSMAAALIPGYTRSPMNDFPRIAVARSARTVTIVWNDARAHPLGDILMQSYALGSLARVQRRPVRVNADVGGAHFLPALRTPNGQGRLPISWYSRSSPNTAVTDVRAALDVDPRATAPPASSTLVTTGPSDWNSVSSDIVPNFGDYTDNYAITAPSPFVFRDYVAWSDGRLGVPQPFSAGLSIG